MVWSRFAAGETEAPSRRVKAHRGQGQRETPARQPPSAHMRAHLRGPLDFITQRRGLFEAPDSEFHGETNNQAPSMWPWKGQGPAGQGGDCPQKQQALAPAGPLARSPAGPQPPPSPLEPEHEQHEVNQDIDKLSRACRAEGQARGAGPTTTAAATREPRTAP